MDVSKGIVVHRLFEVDCIHNLDAIVVAAQEVPALDHDLPFRIGYYERGFVGFRGTLHQVRLEPEAGFTASAPAHNEYVFIARRFRVFRSA
jgi:hypothetical protein